ncbi:hypothetical protein BJY04DRAFT_219616 [Aspergillus karnatakaensis]|uniref:uncharacterized protein n=1 Tax=Aspergillus karnatakaensis TaxID=1810916 RepID=UPI003CCD4325
MGEEHLAAFADELCQSNIEFDGTAFDEHQEILEFTGGQVVSIRNAFKPTLIPLASRKSETWKRVQGTQWRNCQFGQPIDNKTVRMPKNLSEKRKGINLRVRIRGGDVARVLVIEFTIFRDGLIRQTPKQKGYAPEDKGVTPSLMTLEDQRAMNAFLVDLSKENLTKGYRMINHSLEAHVFRLALTKGRTLMGKFLIEEQKENSRTKFWVDAVDSGEITPQGDEADMLAMLRDYTNQLQTCSFRELDDDLKSETLLAFKGTAKVVINEAKVLPTVQSTQGELKTNEFGSQLHVSLANRLLRTKRPSVKIKDQFRFNPMFAKWPNSRTYDGQLISHPSTESLRANSNFTEALRTLSALGSRVDRDRLANTLVNINGSSCEVDPESKSRYNDLHVKFIVELVVKNCEQKGYETSRILIITPYVAQVVRIRRAFFQAHRQGRIPVEQIPMIISFNSTPPRGARQIWSL